MATTNLEYASTVSSNWGVDIARVTSDDGAYAKADSIGQLAVIALTNLPAGASSVNSVQVVVKDAFIELRGGRGTITTGISDASGTFYNENTDIDENPLTYTLTERTTSDGSAAWTVAQINDLRLNLAATSAIPHIGSGIQIDYVYAIVDYNTGYGHNVSGVRAANIGNISGVAAANIGNIIGV